MKAFNAVFLKTIETPLIHFYHLTDDITNTNVNSASRPSGVGKLRASLLGML